MTAGADRLRRVGVFGGTFDPPHLGHVTVAGDVADALGLDEVLWVPAFVSPFKTEADATPPELRLRMAHAAAQGDARFRVWDGEIRRGGVSFMVDTLRRIRGAQPGAELFLIVGADQVGAFDRWRHPEGILELATLAVMDREGEDALGALPDVPGIAERVIRVPVTRVDVSSTRVRAGVAGGGDWSRWVPKAVAALVRFHGLYR